MSSFPCGEVHTAVVFTHEEAIENVEKKVIVVDCRRPDEYAVSKIPGAENIFFKCEDNEILEALESNGVNEQTHLIINYCSLGYRSAIMTNRIKEALSTNPSLNQGMNLSKFQYSQISSCFPSFLARIY